jgi:acylphosphatase
VSDSGRETGSGSGHVRLVAVVRGHVQGVGFRWFVMREVSPGLRGWVANRADGSVEVVAEGSRIDLEALLEALNEGPGGAWVRGVDVAWEPARGGLPAFTIRIGGHGGDS